MAHQNTLRTPTYRRHKASGQAVVTLSGRDVYLGPHGTAQSKETYRRAVSEWFANSGQLSQDAKDQLTVNELMAAYLRFATGYYKKGGAITKEVAHVKNMIRVVKQSHGRTPAAEFGPIALKAVRQRLIEAGHSRTYINDHVGRVKRMFKWAVENELVSPSVIHGLQAVPGLKRGRSSARETDPVRPVADELVDSIQPHVSRQIWAIIELQRLTGMRSGEVVIMRGCDLDMRGALWLYTPSTHKTEHHGHLRAVELGPKAQEIIRPFLKHDLQAFLLSPIEAVEEQTVEKRLRRKSKVQPSQRYRSKRNPKRKPHLRYTTNSYRRAIDRGCEKAWPPPSELALKPEALLAWRREHHWHPHQLRHNYATRIRKEFGVEAARILLGHRSTAVTELYAEIDRGRVREIVSKVG